MARRLKKIEQDESEYLDELLKEAHALKTVAVRTWTAPWLLTPIHHAYWLLRLDGSKCVNGEWKNVLKVSWDDRLPDGTKLTDLKNRKYLKFLQKAAFLFREDLLDIRSSNTHILYISLLKALTQWIFSQSERYFPVTSGFKNVDLDGVRDFMGKYTKGALFEAGDYGARFLRAIDEQVFDDWKNDKGHSSLYELPKQIRAAIVRKLKERAMYSLTQGAGPNGGLAYVDREKAAKIVQTEVHTFNSDRAIAFFRQFEEEYTERFGELLVRVGPINTEFISHRTQFADQIEPIPLNGVIHAVSTLQSLVDLPSSLEFRLPAFKTPTLMSPLQRYFDEAGKSNHTPWMPLETAFAYLNESLRWSLVYGTALVDFYIAANTHFKTSGLLDGPSTSQIARARSSERESWTSKNLPGVLREAGIERWSSTTRKQPKKQCSVTNAMIILLGACMYAVSGLVPIRIDEIVSLQKICLTFKDGCGFWLNKRKGKDVEEDRHETMNVPIPRVSATAIGLLLRLGVESQPFVSGYDADDAQHLLYLPDFHSIEKLRMYRRNQVAVNYALDMFCDHVGLPPDEHGRRWYARIHENRKSFLLSFVWYFKFSSLDAARWLAGHTDSKYILAYLKANVQGDELTELEADFLAEALWDFGVTKSRRQDVRNISLLYRRVCQHFRVREISEVNERELTDWLDLCLSEGTYFIDVIHIVTKSGKHRIALRVVMKGGAR
jgi:hypothetical protein